MSINIKSPNPYEYIDANIVGSFARIDKGVARGFSASNYLATESFDVSNGESWERVWKVTTGTLGSAIEILDSVVTNYTGFQTQINTSGNLYIWASSNGTSWDLASGVTGSTVLQSNTDYWIKEVFTGTAYQVYLSTTGEFAGEETLEAEIANTAVVKAGQIKLGAHVNQTTFWSGSIDLSQSYININGSRWWSGNDYTKVGSWIDEAVVSGFTTSQYLTYPKTFDISTADSWEMECKFTTGSNIDTQQQILASAQHASAGGSCGAYIRIYSNKIQFRVPFTSTGSSYIGLEYPAVANTEYVVKGEFTGSVYNLYVNGEIVATKESTSKGLYNATYNKQLCIGTASTLDCPLLGSIDLNESYIKINGEYWWRGVEVDQYKEIKRLYQYDKPTYYKYGTEIDATVTGSFGRLDKGVASGFTTANYLTFNSPSKVAATDLNNFEIQFKVTTPSSWTSNGRVINPTDGNDSKTGPYVEVTATGAILQWYNGSYFKISAAGSLSSNTTYWFKWSYDGATIKGYYSVDGKDYVLYSDVAPSYKPFFNSTTYGLGIRESDKDAVCIWNGSIDLTQSYININGEYWWSGEHNKVGSWIDDSVFKGASNCYAKLPETLPLSTADSWEFKTKYFYNGGGTYPCLLGTSDTVHYNNLHIITKDGLLKFYLSSNGSSWDIASEKATNLSMTAGTTYWLKLGFNGTQYYCDYNLDGSNTYTRCFELASTTKVRSTNPVMILNEGAGLTTYYNNGSIDFLQTSFMVNGKLAWHGTKAEETTADDYEWFEKKPMLIKQVYKTDKPKYYKTIWEDWTQPVLTANGTMGGNSFAVAQSSSYNSSDIWKCFSGVSGGQWHSAAGLPQWVSWYNPEALKVSKISIVGLAAGNIKDGIVQACNDNSSWVDIATFSNDISVGDFEIDLSSNDKTYKYWRIYITSCYYVYNGSYYPLLGAITINAQTIKAIGGNDYDYSLVIPTLVYEHNPTVFEQSTAGTYTFNVTETAPYEITLVGGGGGGAFNSSGNAGSAAAGNSGSGLVVNAVLKAGTYVLNVGKGGAWSGWLDANTWGGNGSQSSISKDGVVIATAGGGTGNHAWWRSGSAHNSTVGAAPTYTDALGVRDVILNRQGNWGGLAATSSGGASVISGTTWGKGGDTRNRNAADNGNAGCIRIVRLEK